MAEKSKYVSIGFPFCSMLAILFIALKLCGVIDWSWWWVLAPLWIPPAIGVGLLLLAGFLFVVGITIAARLEAAAKAKQKKEREAALKEMDRKVNR